MAMTLRLPVGCVKSQMCSGNYYKYRGKSCIRSSTGDCWKMQTSAHGRILVSGTQGILSYSSYLPDHFFRNWKGTMSKILDDIF